MDPERVTLRYFLDVAYGILVDEYRKLGMGLFEALDSMKQWASGDGEESADQVSAQASDNAASLAQLNAMMKDMR